MNRDLSNRVELQRLLRHFYELVLKDPIIGYLFVDVAKIDMDVHLPKVVNFWHDMVFKSSSYDGELYAAHAHIHQQAPLKPGHFTRWLFLLDKAVKETAYAGENTERLLSLAKRISKSMSAALSQQRRDSLVLSLDELKDSSHQP